jgi:hypothetical protein
VSSRDFPCLPMDQSGKASSVGLTAVRGLSPTPVHFPENPQYHSKGPSNYHCKQVCKPKHAESLCNR